MKEKMFCLALVMITIVVVCDFSVAQENTDLTAPQKKVINDMSVKLQQKVLLSNEQKDKVVPIITEIAGKIISQADIEQDNLTSYQNKIAVLLDSRQKAKYEIIKNDWWNTLVQELKKAKN